MPSLRLVLTIRQYIHERTIDLKLAFRFYYIKLLRWSFFLWLRCLNLIASPHKIVYELPPLCCGFNEVFSNKAKIIVSSYAVINIIGGGTGGRMGLGPSTSISGMAWPPL